MPVHGDYPHTSGGLAMTHLLEQVPALDAVFVNSDLMAIGAIREIHLIYYNPSNECCPEM